MPIYVIGDIHGCFRTLRQLLERIEFNPSEDRLWLVGDLVNRGPSSLEVLRWAREHESRLTVVLGNHDLNLLGRAEGVRAAKTTDTFDEILRAPDRDELLAWLRQQPFLHRDGKFVLVHAGLLPGWTLEESESNARQIASAMRSAEYADVLAAIYAKRERRWLRGPKAPHRWRVLADVFTRLRLCTPSGEPFDGFTGPPEAAPGAYLPWFAVPGRRQQAETTILFGHWAALGLRMGPGFAALDSGCAWGGPLTALRLPDLAVFQQPNADLA